MNRILFYFCVKKQLFLPWVAYYFLNQIFLFLLIFIADSKCLLPSNSMNWWKEKTQNVLFHWFSELNINSIMAHIYYHLKISLIYSFICFSVCLSQYLLSPSLSQYVYIKSLFLEIANLEKGLLLIKIYVWFIQFI